MRNTELNKSSTIESLHNEILLLKELIIELMNNQNSLGDWVNESQAQKITGLSRGTLLKLRKEGKISSSSIAGKTNYYRVKDFVKLLEYNEQNR